MEYYVVDLTEEEEDYPYCFETEKEAKEILGKITDYLELNGIKYKIVKISKEHYNFILNSMIKPMYN